MRCAHDPSRFCRGWNGRSRYPQQKSGDTRTLRSQRQLAAADEIELLRLAPDFQHHRAHGITGKRIGGGTQGILHVRGAHRHEITRIKPKLGQSAHRQRADFAFRKILPHPDQRPSRRDAPRQAGNKSRSSRTLVAAFTKHLMHCCRSEPALQHSISFHMAERGQVWRMGLHAFDTTAQSRKRAQACAAHHQPASL